MKNNLKLVLFVIASVLFIITTLLYFFTSSLKKGSFSSALIDNTHWLEGDNSNLSNVVKTLSYEGYVLHAEIIGDSIELTFKNFNGVEGSLETVKLPNKIKVESYIIIDNEGNSRTQILDSNFSLQNLINAKISIKVSWDLVNKINYISEINFYK